MKTALQKLLIVCSLILLSQKYCLAYEQKNYTPRAIITTQKGKTKNITPFSINLDGRNSTDPQNLDLEFEWKYPNNKIIKSKNPRSYRFTSPGKYKITLTVKNPLGLSNTSFIEINAIGKEQSSNGDLSKDIYLNELFPNPKSKDKNNEWIELFNNSNSDINLGNWKISSTKSSQKLSNKTIIKAKDYLVIENLKINE